MYMKYKILCLRLIERFNNRDSIQLLSLQIWQVNLPVKLPIPGIKQNWSKLIKNIKMYSHDCNGDLSTVRNKGTSSRFLQYKCFFLIINKCELIEFTIPNYSLIIFAYQTSLKLAFNSVF